MSQCTENDSDNVLMNVLDLRQRIQHNANNLQTLSFDSVDIR